MLEFSIITISTFVAILNEVVKYISSSVFKKNITRYIPMFSIIFGIILGIVGFYIPDVDMGSNIVEAIFIGISAGSAATGVHQIGKQLYKKDENGNDINDQVTEIVDKIIQNTTDVDMITSESVNDTNIDVECNDSESIK